VSEVTTGLLEPFAYGRGFSERIVGTTPAAGANFTFTMVGQYNTRPEIVLCTFVAAAVAVNRWVELQALDADGNIWARWGAAIFITTGQTRQLVWEVGRGSSDSGSSGADATPIWAPLTDIFLEGSDQLRIAVGNIQGADQLSAIRLTLERFPTGRRGYPEGRGPARLPVLPR